MDISVPGLARKDVSSLLITSIRVVPRAYFFFARPVAWRSSCKGYPPTVETELDNSNEASPLAVQTESDDASDVSDSEGSPIGVSRTRDGGCTFLKFASAMSVLFVAAWVAASYRNESVVSFLDMICVQAKV